MIDFHTHILPGIDDGSSHVEESAAMLTALREQGADTVFLTPHFYPQESCLTDFLEKRAEAMEKLKPILTEDMPTCRLGAEVYYYPGISRMQELPQLELEGTKLLLLEMPMRAWTDSMLQELVDMSCYGGMTLVMAHIERFLPMQRSGVLELLLQRGVRMQVNVSYFLGSLTRRKALKMLRNGQIHMLGTDCHNLTDRKPRLGEAMAVIEKKLGGEFLSGFDAMNRSLLGQESTADT